MTDVNAPLDLDALLGNVAPITAPAAVVTAPVVEPVVTETVVDPLVTVEEKPAVAVERVAGVDFESFDFDDLPAMHRVGGGNFAKRGSKYGFELFPEPKDIGEGKFQYAMKLFPYNGKKDEVSRQVQSAVTAANRAAIKAKEDKQFKTRSGKNKAGEEGIFIVRVK